MEWTEVVTLEISLVIDADMYVSIKIHGLRRGVDCLLVIDPWPTPRCLLFTVYL